MEMVAPTVRISASASPPKPAAASASGVAELARPANVPCATTCTAP